MTRRCDIRLHQDPQGAEFSSIQSSLLSNNLPYATFLFLSAAQA